MRQSFRLRASRLTALLVVFALSVVLYQCGKKSDDPAPSTTSVEGTWKFTGLTANPGVVITGVPVPVTDLYSALVLTAPCSADTKLTFVAGGTMTLSVPSNCTALNAPVDVLIEQYTGFSSKSKWAVNGSKLTVTRSDGKTQTVYDYTVSGTLLTLSGSDGTTTFTIKMQK